LTYDIVYDIVGFLTMSHTMCKTTSVLYVGKNPDAVSETVLFVGNYQL
jgi:hypothetical protein